MGFPGGSAVKNPPVNAGDTGDEGPISRLGRCLEKEMAIPSSILAWEIPGQRGLAGYSPRGHKELRTTDDAYTDTHRHTHTHSLAQKMRNYNLYHSMAAVLMGVPPHPTQTPTSILVYLLTQTSKHSPKKLCFNNIFWQLQNIRIVNKYQQHIWRLLSILLKILIPSNASRNRNLSSSPWSLTVKLTLLLFKKKVYWDINHTEDSLV